MRLMIEKSHPDHYLEIYFNAMASVADSLGDHNYCRQNPEDSSEATANFEGQMGMYNENLLRVKSQQDLSEVEPIKVEAVASNKITSAKSQESSLIKRLQIQPVMQINIPGAHQHRSALNTTEVDIKLEPSDTDDPLSPPQVETKPDREALGLSSTWDVPLDIVKEEMEDEDEGVAKRPQPGKYHGDVISAGHLTINVCAKKNIEEYKSKTNSIIEDKENDGNNIVEACDEVDVQIHKNDVLGANVHQGINNDTYNKLKPYKCDTCQKCFSRKNSLHLHVRRIHICEKPYECHVCKKCFLRKCELYTHGLSHTGEKPYECNVCKKGFTQKGSLNRHILYHTGEKPYECNVCQKCFTQKRQLNNHIRTHTSEKPYVCNVCQKCFTVKSGLDTHMRYHTGEKLYECNVCKKCFLTRSDLVIHIRSHTGDKPYECYVCKKCFTQRGSLDCHIRIHTGEKRYECNVCKKRFNKNSDLKKHIRLHTGEKPYACNVCEKRFPQKYQLASHFRLHTGEKPFECNLCTKRFVHKSALVCHISTHTGEKPYECNICKKCFNQKTHLNRHLRTHTNDKSNE